MIWLTWRQFRAQAVAAAAVLVLIAALLAVTAPALYSLYHSSGLADCQRCAGAAGTFTSQLRFTFDSTVYNVLAAALYGGPALIGMFWGAPLVARELETGTVRLAWNQSVTRTRWMLTKVGLGALGAMAAVGLLSLLAALWSRPVSAAAAAGSPSLGFGRLAPVAFGASGVTPVAYAAFAFALGVLAGVLIRRSIPAMAVTLAVFGGMLISWTKWVRPHLLPARMASVPLISGNGQPFNELMISGGHTVTVVGTWAQPGAWLLSNQTVTASGRPFTGPAAQACTTGSMQACTRWLASLHLRQLITYQPASRYWPLQWEEAGLFLLMAILLTGLSVWWIRRRS